MPPIGWSLERIYFYFPRLAERKDQQGITLSGEEQQMLAVAWALARDIKKLGITTIIVEQNAVAALKLADRAIILDMGQIVFDGTALEGLDNEEQRMEYLAI